MPATLSRTPNYIIEKAYKILTLFSDFQNTLPGGRAQEGLDTLNSILSSYGADNQMIAYDSLLNFNLIASQREYVLAASGGDVTSNRIAQLKYVFLTDSNQQYPVSIVDDDYFYNRFTNLTNSGRPTEVFLQNETGLTRGQSRLTFLTLPDEAYACTVKAKFVLSDLTLGTDLTTVPDYYLLFLSYELARMLKDVFEGAVWDAKRESTWKMLKNQAIGANDIDLTAKTSGVLNGTAGIYNQNYWGP